MGNEVGGGVTAVCVLWESSGTTASDCLVQTWCLPSEISVWRQWSRKEIIIRNWWSWGRWHGWGFGEGNKEMLIQMPKCCPLLPSHLEVQGEYLDVHLWQAWVSLVAQLVKNLPAMWETWCSTPGLRRSSGEGNGYSLQYCGRENSMDGIVHGVAKSWTRLSNFHSIASMLSCSVKSDSLRPHGL